jgi:hypothetical protein
MISAWQILDCHWALTGTCTATQLKDGLHLMLADGYRNSVTEVGGEWSSRWALVKLEEM